MASAISFTVPHLPDGITDIWPFASSARERRCIPWRFQGQLSVHKAVRMIINVHRLVEKGFANIEGDFKIRSRTTYLCASDWPGGDYVRIDAPRAIFNCHIIRKRVYSGFGNCDVRLERGSGIVECCTDENNSSSCTCGRSCVW